ncbi:LytTR family DNA-binding domain-containing protein [Roseivirga sp. E12]|uniref:LytR/AlgR family response regulator transcription factor n=1 Tax=Roseivirga sp. E12 TaxID=2819237 RepID=UPI001ABC7CE6|nr:LytTR family DNA-binding domain-containing protein [Roseivirga sp. E12]MBO3699575.1 response regulator transcription factor [Roseivirga sp. E12]
MKLKCIIIDDEPLARKLLVDYCQRVDYIELLGDFSSGLTALTFLKDHTVDLIFLDIKMPDFSGLELSKSIGQSPSIIFTTAFAEYAVDAFELNAVDYLLKPFDFGRFVKAINRLKAVESVASKNGEEKAKDFLFIKDGRELVKVYFKDILYIKGQKDYVQFQMRGSKILSLMNLKDLENDLPESQFIRIHQSYIVNLEHLQSISNDKVKIMEEYLPISQTYRLHVRSFLDRYS